MKDACKAIAKLKDSRDLRLPDKGMLDRWLHRQLESKGILHPGWNSRDDTEAKILDGETFARLTIPFTAAGFNNAKAEVETVDAGLVLGGNYRNMKQLTLAEAADLADVLDTDSHTDDCSAAHYVKLGPFPLYVPSEGKNRVSVYRRLGRQIVARVYVNGFPPAKDLVLRWVKPWQGMVAVEYIGDDPHFPARLRPYQRLMESRQGLALIPFQEGVELLTAYGVKWGDPVVSLTAPLQRRKLRIVIGHSFYVK